MTDPTPAQEPGRIEPVEVKGLRVYDCPVCNERFATTPEQAYEHVNTPVSKGVILPRGFVYGNKESLVDFKPFCLNLVTGNSLVVGATKYPVWRHTHDLAYQINRLMFLDGSEETEGWRVFTTLEKNSTDLLKRFASGDSFILNDEQFEELINHNFPKIPGYIAGIISRSDLKRTCPGIEKWIGGQSKS